MDVKRNGVGHDIIVSDLVYTLYKVDAPRNDGKLGEQVNLPLDKHRHDDMGVVIGPHRVDEAGT